MHESEADVPACMASLHQVAEHEPFVRLNKEVKRRADVVGSFPIEESFARLIGAALFERNDDRQSRTAT